MSSDVNEKYVAQAKMPRNFGPSSASVARGPKLLPVSRSTAIDEASAAIAAKSNGQRVRRTSTLCRVIHRPAGATTRSCRTGFGTPITAPNTAWKSKRSSSRSTAVTMAPRTRKRAAPGRPTCRANHPDHAADNAAIDQPRIPSCETMPTYHLGSFPENDGSKNSRCGLRLVDAIAMTAAPKAHVRPSGTATRPCVRHGRRRRSGVVGAAECINRSSARPPSP